MKKLILPLIFMLCFAGIRAQDSKAFRSISLEPTPAFLRLPDGKEARMARLIFNDGVCVEKCEIRIQFNGHATTVTIAPPDTISCYELALPGPDITKQTQLVVSVANARNVFMASTTVNPTRRWDVYLTPHSHVDIGYTDLQPRVYKLHCENIDAAIEVAEKSAQNPAEARYVWNIEVMTIVEEYLKNADDAKKQRFWNAVKKGYLSMGQCFTNMNTSNISTEGLIKSFEYAAKLGKENGVTIDNMYQGDIPGASWGLTAISGITGQRSFLSGPNLDGRTGMILPEWQDRPFYWKSPSGKDRIFFYQCHPYNLGWMVKGSKIPNVLNSTDIKPFYTGDPYKYFLDPALFPLLDKIGERNLPYDMTVFTWSMSDNCPIDPELPEAVMIWNKKYTSPRLIITSMKKFMDEFENRYRDQIPEYRGDITEYWTDGVSTSAFESGLYRNNIERIQQLEALYAITGKKVPAQKLRDAWHNLLLFSEHTWGAHNSAVSPDLDFVKDQWKIKQAFSLDADKQLDELYEALNPEKPSDSFAVANTTAFPKTQLVKLSQAQSSAGAIVTDAKGKKVPTQRLSTGELAFIAENVQPFSTASFNIKKGDYTGKTDLKYSDNTIENKYYTIKLNKNTGYVSSIYSKTLGRELINPKDTLAMNQYIYVIGKNHDLQEYAEWNYYLTNKAHLKDTVKYAFNPKITLKEAGPVVATIRVEMNAPGCRSFSSEYSLVAGIDQIDIRNDLDKIAVRDKEAVHFAFPFDVPDAKLTYDIPAAYATANAEQLPGSCKNWYTVQNWVQASNSDFSVTWTTPDAPLIELGKVTANMYGYQARSPLWLSETKPTSTILSWALNNHWFTNFKAEQDGPLTFRYSFTARPGNDIYDANQFGTAVARQLIVASLDPASLPALITGKGAYVSHCKNSEDGRHYILTVRNMYDQPVSVSSKKQFVKTNILEEELGARMTQIDLLPREVIRLKIEK